MLHIEEQHTSPAIAWLQRGFRPFFLGAMGYAVVVMALWLGIYVLHWNFSGLATYGVAAYWHGHEMIFGYALAVVAGFLLTAVQNWTGLPTVSGIKLALLFALWAGARFFSLSGGGLPAAVVLDLLFQCLLLLAIALPLYRAAKWGNFSLLVSKLVLLLGAEAAFALGLFGQLGEGLRYGLFGGLYLILSLILVMSRRVLPFFIERAAGGTVRLRNARWLDVSALIAFVLFAIIDLIVPDSLASAGLALLLAALHGWRLAGWHHPVVWRQPLLWVLYLAYGWLVIGFLLKAAAGFGGVMSSLAVHAFAYGGIGMMTAGMMARVSLGHTGRDIYAPPAVLKTVFTLLLTGTVIRVLLPLLMMNAYPLLITLSQLLWLVAFLLLFMAYLPILLRPRLDSRPG